MRLQEIIYDSEQEAVRMAERQTFRLSWLLFSKLHFALLTACILHSLEHGLLHPAMIELLYRVFSLRVLSDTMDITNRNLLTLFCLDWRTATCVSLCTCLLP